MKVPPSPVALRRQLNELAGQLRVMAGVIDTTANELFQIAEIRGVVADELRRELEDVERELMAAVRDGSLVVGGTCPGEGCDACPAPEGRCVK